jgi:hypothetical protein
LFDDDATWQGHPYGFLHLPYVLGSCVSLGPPGVAVSPKPLSALLAILAVTRNLGATFTTELGGFEDVATVFSDNATADRRLWLGGKNVGCHIGMGDFFKIR